MEDWELEIERYLEAEKTYRSFKAKYGNYDRIETSIELNGRFGIKKRTEIGNSFCIYMRKGDYHISYPAHKAILDKDKWYMMLENGNIGRFSFVGNDFYDTVSNEWREFYDKLAEASTEYDKVNCGWYFEAVDKEQVARTVEFIRNTIKETKEKMIVKINATKKERLLKELAELEATET